MEKCALFFNYKCYSSSNFKSLCLFHLFYCSQYVRWQFFSYLQKLARRFAVVCPTRRAFSRLEGCITPPYPPPPGVSALDANIRFSASFNFNPFLLFSNLRKDFSNLSNFVHISNQILFPLMVLFAFKKRKIASRWQIASSLCELLILQFVFHNCYNVQCGECANVWHICLANVTGTFIHWFHECVCFAASRHVVMTMQSHRTFAMSQGRGRVFYTSCHLCNGMRVSVRRVTKVTRTFPRSRVLSKSRRCKNLVIRSHFADTVISTKNEI